MHLITKYKVRNVIITNYFGISSIINASFHFTQFLILGTTVQSSESDDIGEE